MFGAGTGATAGTGAGAVAAGVVSACTVPSLLGPMRTDGCLAWGSHSALASSPATHLTCRNDAGIGAELLPLLSL
jgi:hypothetical protein